MKLKISALPDDKPVKISVELPARVHRDLLAYAEIVARDSAQTPIEIGRLAAAMVSRFMATDRAFARFRQRTPDEGE
ncbi:DUF2274 domain-containing protein [Bradyrhizobium sp. HKCCYLS20291]|uniref:DUF2274 domain-containing protein n=1 Tax=Bradyrhizobium sp. HKCCYLS20291 TaxID=3420766 RepID=UPI003EBFCC55